jgi:predicted dehydrogenase
MIGCQYRFHPLLVRLRDQLLNGRLGNIIGARAEWGEYLPDWHPWENHRQSYSARSDLGGGVILTLIHPLDYLYWMFGEVRSVQGATRKIDCLETAAGEDWAEITLEFASGVLGQVHLDYYQRPPVHRLWVSGERGNAVWDYHAGSLQWHSSEGNSETEVVAGFDRNNMFLDEMKHFLDCVRTRRQTDVPLGDGIAVLDIALRAKQSAVEVAA